MVKKKRKKQKLKKPTWLDRGLIMCPYYTLCTSQDILRNEIKRFKLGDKEKEVGLMQGAGATTSFLYNDKNERVAIVCLFNHSFELEQIYSLLAHEAVHIFQETLDIIREKKPSPEFEAYSIQKIAQELFYEYKRQKPGRF